jgi:hypothetical protein
MTHQRFDRRLAIVHPRSERVAHQKTNEIELGESVRLGLLADDAHGECGNVVPTKENRGDDSG